MPTCSGCCSEKPAADFLARGKRCRLCRNASYKRWLDANPSARIGLYWRMRLKALLLGLCASSAVVSVVGCDSSALRAHIEGQWKPGQSWANYGRGPTCWCLDHFCPLSAWPDLTCDDQLRQAFNYSNLQPLWTWENKKKGSRLPREIRDGDLHPPARTERDSLVDQSGARNPLVLVEQLGSALPED